MAGLVPAISILGRLVIPGRREASNPESITPASIERRVYGFQAHGLRPRPGMTGAGRVDAVRATR